MNAFAIWLDQMEKGAPPPKEALDAALQTAAEMWKDGTANFTLSLSFCAGLSTCPG